MTELSSNVPAAVCRCLCHLQGTARLYLKEGHDVFCDSSHLKALLCYIQRMSAQLCYASCGQPTQEPLPSLLTFPVLLLSKYGQQGHCETLQSRSQCTKLLKCHMCTLASSGINGTEECMEDRLSMQVRLRTCRSVLPRSRGITRGRSFHLMAVSPGSRCCEQVIQSELESGVGHDLYEGHTQPRVQAPDALSAEYTSGCIQHAIVYL